MATEAITLFNYTATTDKASFSPTGYSGRRMKRLRPPYTLTWHSENAGTGAPQSPSLVAKLQDSDDGTNWANVTAFTVTAITAAGSKTKTKTYTKQLRLYVRVLGKTLAAGTWKSGSVITAYLEGTVS